MTCPAWLLSQRGIPSLLAQMSPGESQLGWGLQVKRNGIEFCAEGSWAAWGAGGWRAPVASSWGHVLSTALRLKRPGNIFVFVPRTVDVGLRHRAVCAMEP